MIRSNILFWPLFLGTFLAALYRGGSAPYQMFYLLCGVLTFSLLYVIGVRLLTSVKIKIPRHYLITGQTLKWQIQVRSRFFLPVPAVTFWFYHTVNQEGDATQTIHLNPYRPIRVEVEHIYTCRGRYRAGISHWKAPDYLSLFWASHRVKQFDTVDVLPRVLVMDNIGYNRPQVETSSFVPMAQPEFDGTRPYLNTDTLRSIHWKLSAKTDNFLVKKTLNSLPQLACVLIDMTTLSGPEALRAKAEDKVLETALSLIRHLMNISTVQVLVVTDEVTPYTVTTKQEFANLYHEIGLGEFKGSDLSEVTSQIDTPESAALWLISTHTSAPFTEILTAHQREGEDAYWLFVPAELSPTQQETRVLMEISEFGVLHQVISDGLDLHAAEWMFEEY